MFGSKKADSTLVGTGTTITGVVAAKGLIHVDGRVDGTLEVDGDVSVSSKGRIDGTLRCTNAVVAGRVNGNIIVNGHLRILDGGYVGDEVLYQTVEILKGGAIHGRTRRLEAGETRVASDEIEALNPVLKSVPPSRIGQA